MTISHGARWAIVVVGLLGMQIVMSVSAAILATSDRSNAIVEDYHQSALDWDTHKRESIASQQLGWKGSVVVGEVTGADRGKVSLTLVGRDGVPIKGARVNLEIFHHARGNEIFRVTCIERDGRPGVYIGDAALARAGLWQYHVECERGGERFLLNGTIDLQASVGP